MRKYIRKMLRYRAESIGAKPSRLVRAEFDSIQSKRYGHKVRLSNKVKGTHPRKLWRSRLSLYKEAKA